MHDCFQLEMLCNFSDFSVVSGWTEGCGIAKAESEMKGYQNHNHKIVDGAHGSTRRGRLSHHASKYTYIYFVKHIYINI